MILRDSHAASPRWPRFSLFLLSLLGLPITAGFLGKFYIFNAALESNLIWLAILLALNSVIASYYYLRVMVAMYMREPKQEIVAEPVPWTLSVVLWIAAVGTIFAGLFPARIIDLAASGAQYKVVPSTNKCWA